MFLVWRDSQTVDEAWFEPVLPDGPKTLSEFCSEATCVGDLVILPSLRVVDSAVDLPMPRRLVR
jgi:hypothetical protein